MQLAFVLYKYFPYGGMQRDFLRIAKACQAQGHQIRVYTLSWQGERPEGFDIRLIKAKALTRHTRNQKFTAQLQQALDKEPVDQLIGFNKMPGLDVYFAADFCYEEMAQQLRGRLYRFSARYKHFAAYEKAVFDVHSNCKILSISESEKRLFQKYYQTPDARFYDLPPGIAIDRKAPANSAEIRQKKRNELGLKDADIFLLQVGSGFKTKGVDRSIAAVAAMPEEIKARLHLIVIGQDKADAFLSLAKKSGVEDNVSILAGRDDIPAFLLAADLLIHPAYREAAGMVLLESVVAGLPVMTTDVCGYAHYIHEANCGVVSQSPFIQESFNAAVQAAIENPTVRQHWSVNALAFAERADLYSMPEYAAKIIGMGAMHSRNT